MREPTTFEAGYPGKDRMREKAERMLSHELHHDMTPPRPFSSREHEKTRLYNSGGRVHPMSPEQTDLHIPTREKAEPFHVHNMAEMEHKVKRGGHTKRSKLHREEIECLDRVKRDIHREPKKHGGHMHHKHPHHKHSKKHHRYAEGGPIPGGPNPFSQSQAPNEPSAASFKPDFGSMNLSEQIRRSQEQAGAPQPGVKYATMKRGGHAKHGHHHHMPHHKRATMAAGGILDNSKTYESWLVGEKCHGKPKAHHTHHSHTDDESHGQFLARGGRVGESGAPWHHNYESMMSGSHGGRGPSHYRSRHHGADDESHGQFLHEGGKAYRAGGSAYHEGGQSKAEGGQMRGFDTQVGPKILGPAKASKGGSYAMGGVGKIRHKQADKYGRPIR